jgi:Domain of unknown function (DUF5010)
MKCPLRLGLLSLLFNAACGPTGTAPAGAGVEGIDSGAPSSNADSGLAPARDGGHPGARDAGTPSSGGGGGDDASVAQDASVAPEDGSAPSPFTLGPEWTGPCQASSGAIDVNLGNSPESFVEAAYCQINGSEPPAATIASWAMQLRTVSYVRRIDVVRTLCQEANNPCALAYSDPWLNDPPLTATCARKTSRDVGAVMMFFFGCPGGTNCGLDWANTHAFGMVDPDPIYGPSPSTTGYYAPGNTGFWLRELLDARYAGLQFMLPNVYGYDIQPSTGEAQALEAALLQIDAMGGGMRVGLFNDTWAWGEPAGGTLMNPAPSLSDTDDAAQRIYAVEWKPFFSAVSPPHWYTVNGAPLIYFYNAGTLVPTSGASAVIAEMKQLFEADFGVTPFVVVDTGYGATTSGDGQFGWDTFTNDPSTHLGTETTATGGLTFDNSMVKWDSLGRDDPGAIANAQTLIVKGPEILEQILGASAGANLLLLETWNDLGEGTGITRNYDYYENGSWLPPSVFMDAIRASQCSN